MYQDTGLRLRNVLINKSIISDKEIRRLLPELEAHGAAVIMIPDEMGETEFAELLGAQRVREEETILITDREALLALIGERPVASIGFEREDCEEKEDLSEAEILVQGFEEVDFYFVERIYQRKHKIPWRVIDTRRCYLREMTVADIQDMYELYAGDGMTDYMEGLYDDPREEYEYSKAYIDNMYFYYGYGLWLVFEKESGQLIGRAGLNNQEFHGEVELEMGYAIAKEKQRQGFATEVCRGIIAYAVEGLAAKRINCLIRKENAASVHLAEKLGFVFLEECELNDRKMQRYALELQKGPRDNGKSRVYRKEVLHIYE